MSHSHEHGHENEHGHDHGHGVSPEDIEEEQVHFQNVITTFQRYAPYTLAGNNRRRKDFFTLPLEDQQLLAQLGYKEKLAEVDKAILKNAEFLNKIVANPEIFGHELEEEVDEDEGTGEDGTAEDGKVDVEGQSTRVVDEQQPAAPRLTGFHDPPTSHPHENDHSHSHDAPHAHSHGAPHVHSHDAPPAHSHDNAAHSHSHSDPSSSHGHSHHGGATILSTPRKRYRPTEYDMDKLRSTMKQFVRDWSVEGRDEREAAYGPMKEALVKHFADIPPEERRNFRVLVPGAGLGRLAYDIAKLGFACQGNEFSHYMLLASFFILNRTTTINEHTFYPYVHSFSNLPNQKAMLRSVSIPDVLPSDLPTGANFSLVAGDFEEIYGVPDEEEGAEEEPHAGEWDAIMTCFFIDTAKNIVNYLRVIHRILAPGGVWINLGPLLWHFENNNSHDPSVELDLEEVKRLAELVGFEIKNERTIDTTYVNNSEGMLGYVYHAAFWTATKKL